MLICEAYRIGLIFKKKSESQLSSPQSWSVHSGGGLGRGHTNTVTVVQEGEEMCS